MSTTKLLTSQHCLGTLWRQTSTIHETLAPYNLFIFAGPLSSMRHLKNEVDTIKTDVECGLSLSDNEIKPEPGDVIQCYKIVKVMQDIDWDLEF